MIIWLGAGILGVFRIEQLGYNVGWLRKLALYGSPVLLVLYVLMYFVQPLNTSFPANVPGSVANILIVAQMIIVSPALLVASFFLPDFKGDASRLAQQREKLAARRGLLIFGSLAIISLVLPVIALYAFKGAPRYDSVLSVVINGLLAGALYALIALGYTIVYGIVELINFAHGEIFMLGSLVGFFVLTGILSVRPAQLVGRDTSFFTVLIVVILAIVLAMVVCAILNYAINRFAYKRLRNAPRLAPLITAIGVSFMLQNVALYLISSTPQGYPYLFPNPGRTGNADVVSDWLGATDSLITFPVQSFLVIAATAILLLGLRYLINSTKLGKAMRAVAQNRDAAALMGISIERTISFAFLIGGALAGAAGVIYGIYNVSGSVRYDLGFQNGLFAFTAAVLGGIGNVNGAVLGGFFIGLIYSLCQSSFFSLTTGYLSLSVWAPVAVFGILVLVMVFRPAGLLGDNVQEKV
jgi:branched-chain amino acid transport system permease protein